MFTDEMEKLLVKKLRSRFAKYLLQERKLFIEGLNSLNNDSSNYWFIEKSFITETVTLEGNKSFIELNEKYTSIKNSLCDYSRSLLVSFFSDWEGEDYSTEFLNPYAEITYQKFTFKNLKQVKAVIKSSINYSIRDARFKFEHQPNGKDCKRYSKIMGLPDK